MQEAGGVGCVGGCRPHIVTVLSGRRLAGARGGLVSGVSRGQQGCQGCDALVGVRKEGTVRVYKHYFQVTSSVYR